jgi:OFA family oxalate/formate antiporter-like MFS transporter
VKLFPLSPSKPFDVKRLPFFYGWVILLLSTLGFLASIPGQTMGMAVFTDFLIVALDLTRTQLSMAYLLGTVGSALLLTRAGVLYDRWGGRVVIPVASFALGLMILFISYVDKVAGFFGESSFVGFISIMLGYFGVRFWGQGVLTSASRNVLLVWFERRRGLVSGVRGVFVSLGFSMAPLLLAWMIAGLGWRGALWVMAFVVGLIFSIVAVVFLRDTPQECGIRPDGKPVDNSDSAPILPSLSFTLDQARSSQIFWLVSLSLSIHSLLITAVTFHIVSIFAQSGRDEVQAFAFFLPSALVSTSVNLLASWQADNRSLKPFIFLMLMSFLIGAVGLLNLQHNWGMLLMILGMGAGGGLWGVVSNLAFIRYFGPLHLGAISGLCTSLMVFASAIGPALFSVGLDITKSYSGPIYICVLMIILLLISSLYVRQEELR